MENIDHAAKIRAAIDAVFNPELHSLDEFGGEMCDAGFTGHPASIPPGDSTYSIDVEIISDMFKPTHYTNGGGLTLVLVMQRLALIDLFYSTNLVQFTDFGISQLAQAIFDLSQGNGGHFDSVLAAKAQDFVQHPSTSHAIYTDLFDKQYGFQFRQDPENKGMYKLEQTYAVSIISKYLYFLLEAQGCPEGFPIYDSIVKELLPKIGRKIGHKITKNSIQDIVPYVTAIKTVADVIGVQPRNGLSKFAVFDFFLWRIGKVGRANFSLLLTEQEVKQYKGVLANIKANRATPANLPPLIAQLPGRFLLWHYIYLYII